LSDLKRFHALFLVSSGDILMIGSRLKNSSSETSVRQYIGLSVWVLTLLLIRSAQQSVMAHDEGWYAQQARWIVESGDWVTQQWWGEPIHDRMMGIQWLIAAAYQLFGVSEITARLPGAIACWGSVLLIYDLGRRCLTAQIAWWGAAILAVTPIWMQGGTVGYSRRAPYRIRITWYLGAGYG
jgi:4-amino-4-deoxy-L-arabinose transferase-like glycosyltransferase